MAKKALYFGEAERLYVVEQMTLAEIASRLRLSEKTVRTWKDEGDWETKRLHSLQETQRFDEELYLFARTLMTKIRDDLEANVKVDAGRLYTLGRILPMLSKVKEYEDTRAAKEKEQGPKVGLTDDVLKLIEKEVLGV